MSRRTQISKEKMARKLTNTCPKTGKKKFDTLEEAKARAKYIRKRIGPKVEAYHCKYCGAFHMGHSRPPHRRKPKTVI